MRRDSVKRWGAVTVAFAIFLLLMLSACGRTEGAATSKKMSIRTSELTKTEEKIRKLVQFDGKVQLYDYTVDDSIQSVAVNCYQLSEDLSWEESGGIFSNITSRTGRIAIEAEGRKLKVSCQDEDGETVYTMGGPETERPVAGMSSAVSWNEAAEILPDQEIPLAIRIFTMGDAIHSFGAESFFEPGQLNGYDEVTAITITFSAKGTEEPVISGTDFVEVQTEENMPPQGNRGKTGRKVAGKTDGYTARFELFKSDPYGILVGGLDRENSLYHVAHGSILEDENGKTLTAADLKPGMIVELSWNGMVQETYPGQFSYEKLKVTGETGSREFMLYTQLLKELADMDPGLNDGVTECYLDLTKVFSLSEIEKEGLAYLCGSYYNVMGCQDTAENLAEAGILDPLKGLKYGILVTVEEIERNGNTVVCSANKYRSGTGAYYFTDVTAVYENGEWNYQIGSQQIS